IVLAVLALAAALLAVRLERGRFAVLQIALAAVAAALLTAAGPTSAWRHSGIGAGRAARDVFTTPNHLRAWLLAERRATVWDGDGGESSGAPPQGQTRYPLLVNRQTHRAAPAHPRTPAE